MFGTVVKFSDNPMLKKKKLSVIIKDIQNQLILPCNKSNKQKKGGANRELCRIPSQSFSNEFLPNLKNGESLHQIIPFWVHNFWTKPPAFAPPVDGYRHSATRHKDGQRKVSDVLKRIGGGVWVGGKTIELLMAKASSKHGKFVGNKYVTT